MYDEELKAEIQQIKSDLEALQPRLCTLEAAMLLGGTGRARTQLQNAWLVVSKTPNTFPQAYDFSIIRDGAIVGVSTNTGKDALEEFSQRNGMDSWYGENGACKVKRWYPL